MRTTREFSYSEFGSNVTKYVRANHVQTDKHWKEGPFIPNGLMSDHLS
jgi:hypothetical protein